MRSKWSSALGISLLAGLFLYVGASCLSLDTDRSCGEGEPPCYKGEVCFEGRCYDEGNLPDRYGDTEPTDGSQQPDARNDDSASADADTAPRDVSDSSDAVVDSKAEGDDVSDASDAGPETGDTSPSLDLGPSGSHCRQLDDYLDSGGLGGLREVWNQRPDAGPLPKHPGTSCSIHSDCNGRCRNQKCVHRLFTTSTKFPSDFGSLKQADCACQLVAVKSGESETRQGVYRAILSAGSDSAAERLEVRAPVFAIRYDPDWVWTRLFDGASDLWSNTQDPGTAPSYDEEGQEIPDPGTGNTRAWTGWEDQTTSSGYTCDKWTTAGSSAKGTYGNPKNEQKQWIRWGRTECTGNYHIYCLEQ